MFLSTYISNLSKFLSTVEYNNVSSLCSPSSISCFASGKSTSSVPLSPTDFAALNPSSSGGVVSNPVSRLPRTCRTKLLTELMMSSISDCDAVRIGFLEGTWVLPEACIASVRSAATSPLATHQPCQPRREEGGQREKILSQCDARLPLVQLLTRLKAD